MYTSATRDYFADAIRRTGGGGNPDDLLRRYKKATAGLDPSKAFRALGGGRMFGDSDRARYDKLMNEVQGDGSKGDAKVDIDTFQQLLNRLEGSKKRQQRQKSVEGRRDIYAGGMASMMSNF